MEGREKELKRGLLWGCMLLGLFVVWTALVQVVDVQLVGQNGTKIGFATFNVWFHKLTGTHMTLYTITDWLGLIAIVVCVIFGAQGLFQWIKRRRLLNVDCNILLLGIYYIVVIAFYLMFEMIPINYRPVLIDGRMEASYPSSTTLLVLSVMPTLIFQVQRRLENRIMKWLICMASGVFSAFIVMGRLFCGVHWFTDIVGSVILSAGLFCIYKAIVLLCGEKENE